MSIEERREARIRNYRRYRSFADVKGVTDYQVSVDTGLHNVMFSEWKSGKCQPKIDKMMKLANYLGVPIEQLLA